MKMTIMCMVILCFVISRGYAEEPMLVLALAAQEVRLGDPLYVKVTLSNKSEHAIPLNSSFGCKYGTVGFELRKPQELDFAKLPLYEQGIMCFDGGSTVKPGESLCTYELLWWNAGHYAFEKPGKYELRAYVGFKGETIRSKVSEVVVHDNKVHDLTPAQLTEVCKVIGSGGFVSISRPTQEIDQLSKKLAAGRLKETLFWIIAMANGWRDRKENDHDTQLRMSELRRKADPITREIMDITIARHFIQLKRWGSVEFVIKNIEPDSELLNATHRTFKRERAKDHRSASSL